MSILNRSYTGFLILKFLIFNVILLVILKCADSMDPIINILNTLKSVKLAKHRCANTSMFEIGPLKCIG